jgi:hypothetical protein
MVEVEINEKGEGGSLLCYYCTTKLPVIDNGCISQRKKYVPAAIEPLNIPLNRGYLNMTYR